MIKQVLYFGAWSPNRLGHYLYRADGNQVHPRNEDAPVFNHGMLDGGLLPRRSEQPEGRFTRTLLGGWTIVSFWDRTGDDRRNSNSAFLAEGVHTADSILSAAREAYPQVFERFTFELVEEG